MQSSVCAVLSSVLCQLVCSNVWAVQCSLLCHLVCRLARCSQVQPGGGIGSRLARTDMTNGLRTSRRAIIPNAPPGAHRSTNLVHNPTTWCTTRYAPLHNCTIHNCTTAQLHNCTIAQLYNCTIAPAAIISTYCPVSNSLQIGTL